MSRPSGTNYNGLLEKIEVAAGSFRLLADGLDAVYWRLDLQLEDQEALREISRLRGDADYMARRLADFFEDEPDPEVAEALGWLGSLFGRRGRKALAAAGLSLAALDLTGNAADNLSSIAELRDIDIPRVIHDADAAANAGDALRAAATDFEAPTPNPDGSTASPATKRRSAFVASPPWNTGTPDGLGPGVDLTERDLNDIDLSEQDLSGANLTEAILVRSNLHRTSLRNANLTMADLRGATLVETDLTGADLSDADLSNTDLAATVLSGVKWRHGHRPAFPAGFDLPPNAWATPTSE